MKEILWSALRGNREAFIWKLEGLGEYDLRRPMTRTGTNLLGVMKHVASEEYGYFGENLRASGPGAAGLLRRRNGLGGRRHVGDAG